MTMTRVTVDAELKKKLLNCTTPLELCDERGYVLAKLTPSTPWTDPENWESLGPESSDEEIEREIDGGEFYTTQELIDEIKKLKDKDN
jgi:hypothetical protein